MQTSLRSRCAFVVSLCAVIVLCSATSSPAVATQLDAADATPKRSATEILQGKSAKDPMTELLHWAVEHSSPEGLKEVMQKYKEQNLTLKDVYGKDFMDALFVNEASEMTMAIATIADFKNQSLADDYLNVAVEQLREFVDQVDNAGNLHRMGGLTPLLDLVSSDARGLQTRAEGLWTLGVAAQNNLPVQQDLQSLDAARRLAELLPSCNATTVEDKDASLYCAKLLFALSSASRGNAEATASCDQSGFYNWLLEKGVSHPVTPIAKKALAALQDTLHSEDLRLADRIAIQQDAYKGILVQHINSGDVDMAEKSLRFIDELLALRPFLFSDSTRAEFDKTAKLAVQHCRTTLGNDEELCDDIQAIATSIDKKFAARDISDDEL